MISASPAARAVGARASADRNAALLIFALWACFATGVSASAFGDLIARLSTDDAMRLVEVRDLLSGQPWFDLTQHRLNPPDGVLMHWSRLIDLPIAAMLFVFERVFAPDLALKLALVVWPALLLLGALFAAASVCRALAGPEAGPIGALMLLLSPAFTNRFGPAGIDHHGAQLLLALLMLACAMRVDRSAAAAIGAGLCGALMLAVGMETLPHLAAIAALIALRWGFEGATVARGARLFGVSFALGTMAVALATLPPASWIAPVCDALGIGHLAAASVAGFGLAAVTVLAHDERPARLAALVSLGVVALSVVTLVSPNCLAAPYADLPEKLKQGWLADVQEARTFFAAARAAPADAAVIGLPLLAVMGAAGWAAWTATYENRWRIWTAVGVVAVSFALTLWQVRGASLAYAFGGPLLTMAALAIGRTGTDRIRLILAVAALSPMSLALAGLGAAQALGLPARETATAMQGLCPAAEYRALSRLPKGVALNTIDAGPFILAFSNQSAIAAPYHRNVAGIGAAIDAFDGSEESARAVAISRKADYVVACATDGGVRLSAKAHPGGFAEMLMAGRPPAWLEPVDIGQGSRLKVWRIAPLR